MNLTCIRIPLSLRRRSYRWMRLSLLTMFAIALIPSLPALAQNAAAQANAGFLGQIQSFFGQIQDWLVSTLDWIDGLGPIAPIAFIILYVIITVSLLPASVITLGAGFVFGVVKGSIFVFIGAMLGATAAFLIGRYLARDWVNRKISNNRRFKAIDSAIANEGRKIIFLIRLSPIFPFNLLNYALGLTNISLKDYILGTTGIIPGTIMYVYLGSLAGNLATLGTGDTPSDPVVTWIIRILAFLTTVAIVFYVTYVARKALKDSAPSLADDGNEATAEG